MTVRIPTYESRLTPEGFQNIRATAPDMSVNTADTQGMRAFGEAVSTFGAQQYQMARERNNADNTTVAMSELSTVRNDVEKDLFDNVAKMEVGGVLPTEDGKTVPFAEAMQAKVKARYDAVVQRFANATPEVKQYVARQVIAAQATWNSEITTQQEKGVVVARIQEFDKGFQQRMASVVANPDRHDAILEENKAAVANLGISPDARYKRLIETQTAITKEAILRLEKNPATNGPLLQALKERVGNYGTMADPFKSQPGQAAGYIAPGLATSTDLGEITKGIAGAEGTGKNPTSSAVNKYQFVDGTFIAQAKASFPELKTKSDGEILALRGTVYNGQPIEEKMGPDHIKANADALGLAKLPVNGATVYLAHFLGVDGAIKLLQADPNTPIEQLTTAKARTANPSILKPGMTAQNIINWAANTMNGKAGGAVPEATPGQPGQPSSAPATRQEVPGWISNIVNQMPADTLSQALISATSELQRQNQTMAAAFNEKKNDDIASALAGVAPQRQLTQAEFMQHHPYDGQRQYENYAANLQAGEVISGLKTKSPGEALATIEAYRPRHDTPGFEAAQIRYNAIREAFGNVERVRQADPVQWAIDNKVGNAQPFKSSSPQDVAQELKKRAAIADVMSSTYNTDRASLFTKNEAASFQKAFENMPYDQRLGYLEAIRSVITDPKQYIDVIQKIRPDSPATAVVGWLLMKDGQVQTTNYWSNTVSGPDIVVTPSQVARLIAKGEDIRNPSSAIASKDGNGKGVPMPKEEDFKLFFNAATGNAFRGMPRDYEVTRQAVLNYWLAKRVDEGNYKGEVTQAQVTEAVKAVTGGISKRFDVVMPWGMQEDRFNNEVAAKYISTMKEAGLGSQVEGIQQRGNLGVLKLDPLSDGKYTVVEGTVPKIDPRTNRALILDLNNPNAMRQSVRTQLQDQLNQSPPAAAPQGPEPVPNVQGRTSPPAPVQPRMR